MTLDTIMVMIAVTAMFATLAFVLGWADRQTNGHVVRTPHPGAIADAKHRRRIKNGGLKAAHATFSRNRRRNEACDGVDSSKL